MTQLSVGDKSCTECSYVKSCSLDVIVQALATFAVQELKVDIDEIRVALMAEVTYKWKYIIASMSEHASAFTCDVHVKVYLLSEKQTASDRDPWWPNCICFHQI